MKPFLNHTDLERNMVGVSETLLKRLQLVQNTAARFLTNTTIRLHITPLLFFTLAFNFLLEFLIKCSPLFLKHSMALLLCSFLLTVQNPGRVLRSTSQFLLDILHTKYRRWGDWGFSFAGPSLWKELPVFLRTTTAFDHFKSRLKAYLFRLAFNVQWL